MTRADELVLVFVPSHRATKVRTDGRQNLELAFLRLAYEYRLRRNHFTPSVSLRERNRLGDRPGDVFEITYAPDLGPLICLAGCLNRIKDVAEHGRSDHRSDQACARAQQGREERPPGDLSRFLRQASGTFIILQWALEFLCHGHLGESVLEQRPELGCLAGICTGFRNTAEDKQ